MHPISNLVKQKHNEPVHLQKKCLTYRLKNIEVECENNIIRIINNYSISLLYELTNKRISLIFLLLTFRFTQIFRLIRQNYFMWSAQQKEIIL